MKVLLVYEHLERGGIETLIIRMSNWLVNHNHEVLLYLERYGALEEKLDDRVDRHIIPFQFIKLNKKKEFIKTLEKEKLNAIYSFGPRSGYIAGNLLDNLSYKNQIRFFAGIYHPKEFNIDGRFFLIKLIYANYFKHKIPSESIVFMSEDVKKGIEEFLGHNFIRSNIWPLPINVSKNYHLSNPKKFKIVSIGRFVHFKSYNLYLIPLVKKLRNSGLDIYWDVYGGGPLENEMLSVVKKHELENSINIYGQIDYHKIPEVLKEASVFIGMGTSLIEAASFGVPSIPAIAYYNKPFTYGFVYDLPYYNCGENLGFEPTISFEELLRNLYYENFDVKEIGRRCHVYSQKYDIDNLMTKLIQLFKVEQSRTKSLQSSFLTNILHILLSVNSLIRHKFSIKSKINNLLLKINS